MTQENAGANWDSVEEGVELLRAGETEAAIDELTRVAKMQPDNEYAFFFLGQSWYEHGNFEKALKAYVRSLEIAPEYLGALLGCGHALRMMGRHDAAIRCGRRVLGAQKEDPDALYLLGLVHYTRGDNKEARSYLERFLATSPETEAATEVQGMLQVLGGEVIPFQREADDD